MLPFCSRCAHRCREKWRCGEYSHSIDTTQFHDMWGDTSLEQCAEQCGSVSTSNLFAFETKMIDAYDSAKEIVDVTASWDFVYCGFLDGPSGARGAHEGHVTGAGNCSGDAMNGEACTIKMCPGINECKSKCKKCGTCEGVTDASFDNSVWNFFVLRGTVVFPTVRFSVAGYWSLDYVASGAETFF